MLPTLAARHHDQVVAAIQWDAQLALARSSKYRGVRRVGGAGASTLFEARLPPQRESGEAARAAGSGQVLLPAVVAQPRIEQPLQLQALPEGPARALPESGARTAEAGQQHSLLGGTQAMALDQQLAAAAAAAAASTQWEQAA